MRQGIPQQQCSSRQYVYRRRKGFVHLAIVTLRETSRQTGDHCNLLPDGISNSEGWGSSAEVGLQQVVWVPTDSRTLAGRFY